MALYDPKKKPLTPLEQQAAASQAAYGASVGRATTAQQQAQRIQIPAPIIKEGRGGFSSIAQPGQDAALTALRTLGGVQRQEQAKQTAMIPTFQAQAAGLRQQAGADRAKAATLGANTLLQGVGAAPIASPATPRPAAVASATPAPIASPGVRFAGIDAAPDNFYRNAAGAQKKSPSQSMTLDQANAQEVNAQTARRPGTQVGAGASPAAGAAAPISKSVGKFGETVYSNVGSQYGTPAVANPAGTIGSVNQQNFGNPVVPQASGGIAGGRVASTFGMGVNDPRLNDQTPVISRPDAISGARYRGADQMAEQYNSREDRESRRATDGALDTALFMARGKPGAEAAIANLLETKARLNSGAEGLSQEAIQNRANRGNQFDIAGMEQAGQTQRQQMAGDVAREGNLLDFNAKNRATDASLIERPQYVTDRSGNLVQVAGGKGTGVTGADGAVIQMPQTTKVDNDALSAVNKELTALINNPPEMGADATAYNNRMTELRAQQSAMLQPQSQQAKPPAGYPNAKQAPDGKWYVQKDGATYLVN